MRAATLDAPDEISTSERSTLKAWLQLLRPPNLFTIPGDPLAGFFLASLASANAPNFINVIPCIAASLLLYISGLLFNDYFDRDIDAKERPYRPVPSGRVSAKKVLAAAIVSMAVGVAVSFLSGLHVFYVAVALAAFILIYNGGIKHVPFLGQLNMGLCRGLSVLLGGSAVPGLERFRTGLLLIVAAWMAAYIYSVSRVAATETVSDNKRKMPLMAIILTIFVPPILLIAVYRENQPIVPYTNLFSSYFSLAIVLLGNFWIILNSFKVYYAKSPHDVQKCVGNLIRGLLLIQAALCALFYWQGLVAAGVLIAFFPLSWLTAKKFYAS